MPLIGIFLLLTDLLCIVHAAKTGRPQYWHLVILMMPGVGAVAYLALGIVPDLLAPHARRGAAGVARLVDSDRGFREAARRAAITDSVESKAALAAECIGTGRYDETIELYRGALVGVHATAPDLMLGLARAHFARGGFAEAQAALERLREANPGYQSAEGHLLYARSLEEQGRLADAAYRYEALIRYFPGQEAKLRYALLLQRRGDVEGARRLLQEVCRAVEYAPKAYRRS